VTSRYRNLLATSSLHAGIASQLASAVALRENRERTSSSPDAIIRDTETYCISAGACSGVHPSNAIRYAARNAPLRSPPSQQCTKILCRVVVLRSGQRIPLFVLRRRPPALRNEHRFPVSRRTPVGILAAPGGRAPTLEFATIDNNATADQPRFRIVSAAVSPLNHNHQHVNARV
jgi:ferredoxin